MNLFINSLAASAGGGLTYIRNVIPHLAATPEVQVTVALAPRLCEELRGFTNVHFVDLEIPAGRRFWFEQAELPNQIRRSRSDVLLSAGNFALRKSPVPQILLSRNSVYTSPDFYRDLLARGEYRMYLDTRLRGMLARRSIHWADATVAPSEAFAAELRRWTGKIVCAIHHGFDRTTFASETTPLSSEIARKLDQAQGALRLLFVSHYNYYRNFETLFRALPLLRSRLNGRPIQLLLTCKLTPGENPGSYRTERAAAVVKEMSVGDIAIELGAIPYSQLHQLYRQADIYVTPAYTETFAHPLVEAMASGVPVVASDLEVHREICSDAAIYFPKYSPEALAECVLQVANSKETAERMKMRGTERSKDFSWKAHVEELLTLARKLVASNDTTLAAAVETAPTTRCDEEGRLLAVGRRDHS